TVSRELFQLERDRLHASIALTLREGVKVPHLGVLGAGGERNASGTHLAAALGLVHTPDACQGDVLHWLEQGWREALPISLPKLLGMNRDVMMGHVAGFPVLIVCTWSSEDSILQSLATQSEFSVRSETFVFVVRADVGAAAAALVRAPWKAYRL